MKPTEREPKLCKFSPQAYNKQQTVKEPIITTTWLEKMS